MSQIGIFYSRILHTINYITIPNLRRLDKIENCYFTYPVNGFHFFFSLVVVAFSDDLHELIKRMVTSNPKIDFFIADNLIYGLKIAKEVPKYKSPALTLSRPGLFWQISAKKFCFVAVSCHRWQCLPGGKYNNGGFHPPSLPAIFFEQSKTLLKSAMERASLRITKH